MKCCLCDQPLDGDEVPFGFLGAHKGCAQDWVRSNLDADQQRFDDLESQER